MKRQPIRIGVDLMGADSAPSYIFEAVLALPEQLLESTEFVFFSLPDLIASFQTLCVRFRHSFFFVPCLEVVGMEDEPVTAIKRKKQSTIVCGIEALRDQKIDAFVSCGNTGALVLSSFLTLDRLPGIDKPALLTSLPTLKGTSVLLDVGATPHCQAINLVQFALLGAAYVRTMKGLKLPTVGLLNIGAEFGKGPEELTEAYRELQLVSDYRFIGNVEPAAIFRGDVDVVVTSGFVGNIFLKTAEAVAELLLTNINAPVLELQRVRDKYSQDNGTGAFLLGLKGCVCKCHGLASKKSIQQAIIATKAHVEKLQH